MADLTILSMLLSAAIGGTVEALAGKGIESTSDIRRMVGLVEKQKLTVTDAAVKKAVDCAREEMLEKIRAGSMDLEPAVVKNLEILLNYAPFAEEVTKKVLFQGAPDFDRLRQAYLDADPARTNTRWVALGQPLDDFAFHQPLDNFFTAIERCLLNDLDLGPLLLTTRLCRGQVRQTEIILEASRQVQASLALLLRSSQETGYSVHQLLVVADRQDVRLSQVVDLLVEVANRLTNPGATGDSQPSGGRLSELHLEYLRSWFGKPWTEVKLADISARQERANLLDIYVPLQVDCKVMIEVKDHQITGWWIDREDDNRLERAALLHRGMPDMLPQELEKLAEVEAPKEYSWRDLGVGREGIQQIVDGVQRKILERKESGKETEDGKHRWYMEAHDAATVQPRFVLLGDPGGGKSCFVRHMTLCQAGELRRRSGDDDVPDNASLAALRDWLLTDPLTPIYVELRDLVRLAFPTLPDDREQPYPLPTSDHLWSYVREHVLGTGMAAFEPELRRLCRQGAAMLLLDGLDEAPLATDKRRQEQIKALVASLQGAYPRLRMVITGRPHAYRRGDWELAGFGRAQLEDLDRQRLSELALSLFSVVHPENGKDEAEGFIQAIYQDPHIDQSLRANPLFFTLLAAIWLNPDRPGQLPPTKAALYRQAVDLLLDRWTRHRAPHRPVVEELGGNPAALRPLLETLACTVNEQRNPDQDTTTFNVGLLLQILYLADFKVDIHDVPDYLSQHAGILISRSPGEFTFVHRSFQEHLAACELTCQEPARRKPPVPPERRFPHGLLERIHSRPDLWENVARLAGDELAAAGRTDDLWQLLVAMGRPYLQAGTGSQAAMLALEMVETHRLFEPIRDEFDPHTHALGLLQRMAVKAMTDADNLEPEQRAVAGRLLGSTPDQDSRPGVGVRVDGLPDILWEKVSKANGQSETFFIYGEDEQREEETFWMARYPVTYRQFQAFVDAADGLRNPRWWEGLARTDNDDLAEQRFQFWNHPRDTVTWYQAVAFCRWLTAQAQANPDLVPEALRTGTDWQITLPTEWQWEKAARGHDGRAYPWGPKYTSGHANVDETEKKDGPHKLGQTSAVGLYPQGVSPYGILDLSGNVWEWCLNEYRNPERTQAGGDAVRVMRGGSWYWNAQSASASARYYGGPWGWNVDLGFRVVVVVPHLS